MKIEGFVAPGYETVLDEFERNFAERGELGAAFAAVYDGRPVIDLWGGVADAETGRPWTEDTLQLIFSGTKGLVATCLLLLVERGQLNPDTPVCHYWPEFAAGGKEHVLVKEVASHQARLPGIRTPLREEDILDDGKMAELLAAQAPETDPRAERVYHALTYGWLCGELIRRVSGRSMGRFFAEEVADRLALELWVGLPQELEHRVSKLRYSPTWGRTLFTARQLEEDDLLASVWGNPVVFPSNRLFWNDRAFHAAEIPASNGIGSARSIARLYGCLAAGGSISDVRLVSEQSLRRAIRPLTDRLEPLLNEQMAFGFGFGLQTSAHSLGPPPDAFGHGGAGGSLHGAWPRERVGFSYCMNEMRDDVDVDPRSCALLEALHRAVAVESSAR